MTHNLYPSVLSDLCEAPLQDLLQLVTPMYAVDIDSVLGEGTCGKVFSARRSESAAVAKWFQDAEDTKQEEATLKKVGAHPCISQAEHIYFASSEAFIMAMQADCDLKAWRAQRPAGVSLDLHRSCAWQLVVALEHCHLKR